jgi:hypothetical protein
MTWVPFGTALNISMYDVHDVELQCHYKDWFFLNQIEMNLSTIWYFDSEDIDVTVYCIM